MNLVIEQGPTFSSHLDLLQLSKSSCKAANHKRKTMTTAKIKLPKNSKLLKTMKLNLRGLTLEDEYSVDRKGEKRNGEHNAKELSLG